MPGVIDPETMQVDDLPSVWAPVQWDQTETERAQEIERQAAASLLATADIPEAILRLLLNESEIVQAYDPPRGYKPDEQGEWDPETITFAYRRPIRLVKVERSPENMLAEYDFGDLGRWLVEIGLERITLERI
ncbi:MAG TPA: hypothetical protein VGJ97_03155 [Anaerolineaceae bacterium]|jgi:hypothetical protein